MSKRVVIKCDLCDLCDHLIIIQIGLFKIHYLITHDLRDYVLYRVVTRSFA